MKENMKIEPGYRENIIAQYGLDVDLYKSLIEKKRLFDAKIERCELSLEITDEKTITEFTCICCGWTTTDPIDWNYNDGKQMCMVCIARTYNAKDNKSIDELDERKYSEDDACMVKYIDDEGLYYLMGKIYAKYPIMINGKQCNKVAVLLVNSNRTIEFIMNDNTDSAKESRKNVKLLLKHKQYKKKKI
eukprot:492118_1